MQTLTGFPLPEFRAPPPSPEGIERSVAAGDDELQRCLAHASAVPKLVLPDRVFPREITSAGPPEIDFRLLVFRGCDAPSSVEELRSAARRIGCFQLVNHGIPRKVISAAEDAAEAVFMLGPEKKAGLAMSSWRRCGFEGGGVGQAEGSEEELFWWRCEDETAGEVPEMEMAGIWPKGYHDFSCKMGCLQKEIGKIASDIGKILFSEKEIRGCVNTPTPRLVMRTGEEDIESTLHINKYKPDQDCPPLEEGLPNALQHDAVRLLIRSCKYPHALCIHVPRCSSRFQVFSKRGWMSFRPNSEALVVTIGNQIPVWNGSSYKHVVGRPAFGAADRDSISIAVLYSCSTMEKLCTANGDHKKRTISLAQQVVLAVSLALLYHIIIYLCSNK